MAKMINTAFLPASLITHEGVNGGVLFPTGHLGTAGPGPFAEIVGRLRQAQIATGADQRAAWENDEVVKSQKFAFDVIPAKAGSYSFRMVMDSGSSPE
jgi:hypothetical protein